MRNEKLSERGVAAVVGGVRKRHQRSARHGYDPDLVGQFGRAHSSGLFVRHCVPSILRSMNVIIELAAQLRVKLEANVGKFRIRLQASVPRLRDPTGAYRLLLGSVLESIMIGDSVFRRQPTSALNLRLGRKYTWRLTHAGNASKES